MVVKLIFFICIFINYIIKIEFSIAYLVMHNVIFIKKNIKKNSKMLEFYFEIQILLFQN